MKNSIIDNKRKDIEAFCLEILRDSDLNVLSLRVVREKVASHFGFHEADEQELKEIVSLVVDEYLESFAAEEKTESEQKEEEEDNEKKSEKEEDLCNEKKSEKKQKQDLANEKKREKHVKREVKREKKKKQNTKEKSSKEKKTDTKISKEKQISNKEMSYTKTFNVHTSNVHSSNAASTTAIHSTSNHSAPISDSEDYSSDFASTSTANSSSCSTNIKKAFKSQKEALKRKKSPTSPLLLPQSSNNHSSKNFQEQTKKLEMLKSYISKCGVHKIWKRELEGLDLARSIQKLKGILQELGVEGRPSIEKCIRVKRLREEAQELQELQSNVILPCKLREHNQVNAAVVCGSSTEELLNSLSVIADSE